MFQSFVKTFDIKRFKIVTQIIFILACLFLIVNLTGKAFSRYESRVDVSAEANVAFFVIDQGTYENTISLSGLTPSLDPFYYTFYVANHNTDGKRSNVDMKYKIKFETTTNLPLTYQIIRNESFEGDYTSIISNRTVRQDEYDVFYRVFEDDQEYTFSHNRDEVDTYTLKVIFPESYKNSPDLYQGVIELFSISIDATQVA